MINPFRRAEDVWHDAGGTAAPARRATPIPVRPAPRHPAPRAAVGRLEIALHGVLAVCWLGLLAWFGLELAALGNREASIARARGRDRELRHELEMDRGRVNAQLDWEANPAAIAAAVARLGLPLVPPPRLVARP